MRKHRMATLDFLKIDIEGAEAALFAPEGHPELWMPLLTGCFRCGPPPFETPT